MEAPVSVSLGVVQSLPTKFERLLSPAADHGLDKKVKDKIRVLKDHVHELIDKYLMEALDVETPTSTAKCWLKEVRELSYDIDDFLDELVHVHLADPKNLRRRSRWVADKCSQFRARLRDAIQRHKTYNLDRCKKRPGGLLASEDRPLPPVYGLASAPLVGIEGSMEKLEDWLTGDGERKLRVVSIVGFGGVGKTTLAKKLYGKIESQFECRAFARTSQRPDIRKLLSSILLQVRPERPPEASESSNLIEIIRAHLRHKKYFIIIDDLWASSTWDIVCRALPDDKCCSRVLTTTEIDVVSQGCCGHNSEYILKMGPLRDDDSRKLFLRRFPGDQSDSCEKSEVLFEIIRKCGGFPLATVTMSSLLARQQMGLEQCNFIRRSLSSNLRTNPSMEGMKHVLDLCYNNLPGHLKACILYFSIYKEDHIVWKDDLVKQWIAEGFICAKEGNSMEEVASTYLDELVNGGMIQPVDIDYNGEVLSCTVHYMILNLIRYKSVEENFFITIDGSQTKIRLADKVRRLSVLFGDADDAEPPADLRLSQVRSLVFYGFFKCLPSVVEFRHLRVLILHLWGDQDNISFELTAICKLFGLKYLEIVCNVTLSLPTEMQGLRYLETLKIDSRVSEVPQDIVHLQRLLHLSLPGDTNLPNCIGLLATLRTLEYFDLTRNSADNVLSLRELANVWDLRLTCSELQPKNLKKNMEHLGSVLSKLRNLKSLSLLPAGYYDGNTIEKSASISSDFFYDLSNVTSPSTLLEKLELIPRICILSVFPKWIGNLRLLSILKIEVMCVSGSDIDILQELPALAALSLYVRTAPAERIIFHREGFPVLMQLVFICSALCIAFEEGALPCVRRLTVGFNANILGKHSISEAGLENLTGLEVFSAKIGGAGADEFSEKATVRSVLEDMFCRNMNMSPPIINIQFVGWVFCGGYNENSAMLGTQEIAEEGSTVGMVNHHWDTAFSCEDKATSSTAPAAPQMSEGDSTAEGIGTHHMRKGGSLLDGHITAAVPVADFSAHLQPNDHAMDRLQDPAISHSDEKESSATGATQQIAGLRGPAALTHDDEEITSWQIIAEEEGSTEDIREPAFPHGNKEINSSSTTQQTAEEIIPVSQAQDRHTSRSQATPPPQDGPTTRGFVGRMLGPLQSLRRRVRRPTVSKKTGEGRDELLWWHDLFRCHAGHVSVATVQANNPMEDLCCCGENQQSRKTRMGSYAYKYCMCFTRKLRSPDAQPPPDVRAFHNFVSAAAGDDGLRLFLSEVQGERPDDINRILSMLTATASGGIARLVNRSSAPSPPTLEDFFGFLFSPDLNPPIANKVHQDMSAPFSHYFVFTGHNSYLTGNQLNSDSSDVPIIQALQRGVRVIELDMWPNSSKNNVDILHGGTLTAPVEMIRCLKSIKEYAFCASPYPLVITLEDHLTADLQAKVAQMLTETFGDLLFIPSSDSVKEFPSPESLMKRIIISTKPPQEYQEFLKVKDKAKENQDASGNVDNLADEGSLRRMESNVEESDGKDELDDEDDEDSDEDDPKFQPETACEYRKLITIHAGKPKGHMKDALKVDPEKVRRLSLSETQLTKAASSHGAEVIRFTQKNILRVYPKGTRVNSSNYDPMTAWTHGAQMVAFNMQGHDKALRLMQGFFRANGGCGYVKKPDFLLTTGPNGEVFDPKASLPVKTTLTVKVSMGDGWRMDFSKTHFDTFSPPDFYTRVGIAGVKADSVMKKTKTIEDQWVPVWDEEFSFPLTVPELALLRIEVQEYDMSEKHDFGGQTCLPVWELKQGIRAVPLHDRKGNRYKSVRLLMRFEFV